MTKPASAGYFVWSCLGSGAGRTALLLRFERVVLLDAPRNRPASPDVVEREFGEVVIKQIVEVVTPVFEFVGSVKQRAKLSRFLG